MSIVDDIQLVKRVGEYFLVIVVSLQFVLERYVAFSNFINENYYLSTTIADIVTHPHVQFFTSSLCLHMGSTHLLSLSVCHVVALVWFINPHLS